MTTAEQRLAALDRANKVRFARARVKEDLREGRVRLAQVLACPPAHMVRCAIEDVLLAAPMLGPVKTYGVLRRVKVVPTKRLGELAPWERSDLAAELRARYPELWRRRLG